MFYLVISTPHPSRTEGAKKERLTFRKWVDNLSTEKKITCFYPRVGRGSVVIFDVSSNEELHGLLSQWMNIVPASFDVHPLATPSVAKDLLMT